MDSRIKLSILDHNHNVGREQAIDIEPKKAKEEKDEKRWKYVFSKHTWQWGGQANQGRQMLWVH